MNTNLLAPPRPRARRTHSAEFKAQVIAACLQPGVSMAAVALANQLNANYLRSLVQAYRKSLRGCVPADISTDCSRRPAVGQPPTLVPITVQDADAKPSGDIKIEIRRQQTLYQISWPSTEAMACAQWLREVLR